MRTEETNASAVQFRYERGPRLYPALGTVLVLQSEIQLIIAFRIGKIGLHIGESSSLIIGMEEILPGL